MDYENVVRDFAKRTRKNLEYIEQGKKEGNEVYEITHLINSCLGLLVLPHENYINSIPTTSLDKLKDQGWVVPQTINGTQPNDLKDLIRLLRNGVAHCNIAFTADSESKLDTLKIWNTQPRSGEKTWETELGFEELRSILFKFSDLILEHSEHDQTSDKL
ncbi:HEPN family nuclease [Neptunomonas qingdaonensis]|uniref:pEK499-p136 HEPN domain-containing protein n=1 Tax=Neptunomonas qingdaonensis TaxID=1045558 RepID=A0A1I2RA25_9GAMM|nr:HEPN family nuclease [Neptunomonas qingdaonensis]SFG37312.1 hypothetical protein SAMN05216175_10616 [Neptunomonas qingdaonensis]